MSEIKPNIKDSNGNAVNWGDKFLAKMIASSLEKGTIVTVVPDFSEENLSVDRNFDVEDEEGNRIWNAYMVIKSDRKVK